MKKWSRLTALMLAFAIMLSNASGALAAVEVPYTELLEWIQSVKDANGLGGVVKRILGGEILVKPDTFEPETSGPQYVIGEPVNLSSYADGLQIPVEEVNLDQYGKVSLVSPAAGQWQVYVVEADSWVNVTGETGSTFELTYAKMEGLLQQNNGVAQLRSKMGDNVSEAKTERIAEQVYALALMSQRQLTADEMQKFLYNSFDMLGEY